MFRIYATRSKTDNFPVCVSERTIAPTVGEMLKLKDLLVMRSIEFGFDTYMRVEQVSSDGELIGFLTP